MDKKLFADFKQSLTEAIEHAEGKRNDLRTTTLPRPPQKMTSAEIAALREKLNASQAVFARYLNISVKTVQAWEQGLNKPSGAALRLLTIVQKRPEILLEV
ncbi:MAG: helix-turn-helix domain-containing protein [Pyrinomonadaceae bacterium]